MIYTIALNPSLDYIMNTNSFEVGKINKAHSQSIFAGGKGINVSVVLKNLGVESIILGFSAGFIGEKLLEIITQHGIRSSFVHNDSDFTRINVKVRSGIETDINAMGPQISEDDKCKFFKLLSDIKNGDIVILSGSVQESLGDDFYKQIMIRLSDRKIMFVVDTSGKSLMDTLPYKPFLVKPNIEELEEIFKCRLDAKEKIVDSAKKLKKMGAQNVLVSLDENGALFVGDDGTCEFFGAPSGKVVNTVGAGDSMVAGFLSEYLNTLDYQSAVKMGIAAGSATAFTSWLASKDQILLLNSKN